MSENPKSARSVRRPRRSPVPALRRPVAMGPERSGSSAPAVRPGPRCPAVAARSPGSSGVASAGPIGPQALPAGPRPARARGQPVPARSCRCPSAARREHQRTSCVQPRRRRWRGSTKFSLHSLVLLRSGPGTMPNRAPGSRWTATRNTTVAAVLQTLAQTLAPAAARHSNPTGRNSAPPRSAGPHCCGRAHHDSQ